MSDSPGSRSFGTISARKLVATTAVAGSTPRRDKWHRNMKNGCIAGAEHWKPGLILCKCNLPDPQSTARSEIKSADVEQSFTCNESGTLFV